MGGIILRSLREIAGLTRNDVKRIMEFLEVPIRFSRILDFFLVCHKKNVPLQPENLSLLLV